MRSAMTRHSTGEHSPRLLHGPAVSQRGHQPATNAPGTSALPGLLLPPEHSALLQGLALARQSLETGCRKRGFKIIYYFKCPFSWRRTRI